MIVAFAGGPEHHTMGRFGKENPAADGMCFYIY